MFRVFLSSWQVIINFSAKTVKRRSGSSVFKAFEGRARPVHALSELQLSSATTAVDETAVALGTIMCGDYLTDRTLKLLVRSMLAVDETTVTLDTIVCGYYVTDRTPIVHVTFYAWPVKMMMLSTNAVVKIAADAIIDSKRTIWF
uniref:Uncharacterized protein n=1 Tax=Rhipicephalus microplus TaxID=6941 RepID=A0A6G5AIC7_RHIMP